jgi:hypothetical protein
VNPPDRLQRRRTTHLARSIQRLDSPTISLLVRMVVTLGHRRRLMANDADDRLDTQWWVGAVLSYGIWVLLLSRFVHVFDLAPSFLMYDCVVVCSPLV